MFNEKIRNKLLGYVSAMQRYPLVLLFLLATAIVNMVMIQTDNGQFSELQYTLIIGAVLSAVAQQVYESFFSTTKEKTYIYLSAILLTIAFYFTTHYAFVNELEIGIKTGVLTLSLLTVFVWIPSIKSKNTFDQTFMATIKAFFTMFLFTFVITIGINIVIFAVDQLLINVNYKVYTHVLNVILTLFAPLFFLSLIPKYPSTKKSSEEQQAKVEKAIQVPHLFSVLLSYIIIPLVIMYTFILVVYMLINIRSGFWTDNLLEPMLVSYAVTVIIVTLLVSRIDNSFTNSYRKIIPKVLIPIVLLQIIASALKIGDLGLTHGRYYVILFGLFALIAGIVFSFFSIKRSGWIAVILFSFALISVTPPVDAFTISRTSQIKLLKQTLIENDMLVGNTITQNPEIPQADKKKISRIVNYLSSMDYIKEVDWLPSKLYYDDKFKQTFGFNSMPYDVYDPDIVDNQYMNLDWSESVALDVADYDRIISLYIANKEQQSEHKEPILFDLKGETYSLVSDYESNQATISLHTENKEQLITINMVDVFNEVFSKGTSLNLNEATVVRENSDVRVEIIVHFANQYEESYDGEVYVLIGVK